MSEHVSELVDSVASTQRQEVLFNSRFVTCQEVVALEVPTGCICVYVTSGFFVGCLACLHCGEVSCLFSCDSDGDRYFHFLKSHNFQLDLMIFGTIRRQRLRCMRIY